MELESIDNNVFSVDYEKGLYLCSFSKEEYEHINKALQHYDLVQEIKQLLEESK